MKLNCSPNIPHSTLPVRAIFDWQTMEQLNDLVAEKASKAITGEGRMNARAEAPSNDSLR